MLRITVLRWLLRMHCAKILRITCEVDSEYQQKSLFVRLATHLSRSHEMFSHRTTTLLLGFLGLYPRAILGQYYYIRKIFAELFDAPLHRSTPYWGLLDKIIIYGFCNFESRYVYAKDINNMLIKGPLNPRVIGPVLAWFKGPFRRHFCITCHNKRSVQYQFSISCSFKTLSLSISHLHKIFRNKLPVICKNKKTKAPKFYFLPSKLELGHKNLFSSHKRSKTHTGDKKSISISLPKPQEHTFTRWRKIAYGHWAHPVQRSHISPADQPTRRGYH